MQPPFRSRVSAIHGLAAFALSGCLAVAAWGAPPAPAPASTPAAAGAPAEVKMTLLPSGATEKLGGYNPQQLKLVKGKPAGLKTAPELAAPLYGQIRFGGKNYMVALDEPDGGDAKLYVDSNGNGDLTDDPESKWEKQTAAGPDGKELTQYSGTFQLPLAGDGAGELVSLNAYRFDKNDPRRAPL